MSQENSAARLPLDAWQVGTLRMTAFPSPGPGAHVTEPNWWIDVVGEPPETKTSLPRKGSQQEEGPFEAGKLILRIQPTRIDWLFTSTDDQIQKGESIPTIGSLPESLDTFLRLMLRWFELETCPVLHRIAFGGILLYPVKDRQAGYQQLAAYLPSVRLDPETSFDFLYQINRPRDSKSNVAGLKINRLSKWSVSVGVTHEFSVGPGSIGYFPGQLSFACQLELDINTTPDFQGELPRERLPPIFQELVTLGKEIALEGDIP